MWSRPTARRSGSAGLAGTTLALLGVLLSLGHAVPSHAAGGDAETRALDPIAAHIRAQTLEPGERLLGAAVSPDGHWTLVNRAGERMTAAGGIELARVLSTLAPVPAADAPVPPRLTIVLSEGTLFGPREALRDLPRTSRWRTMVDGRVYPVLTARTGTDAADSLFVEVRPRVVVAVKDRPVFDEAVWQLARPLKRSEVRIVALEPGGPQSLARTARMEPATGRPERDSIDPPALADALAGLRGQTVIVSGVVDDGRLVVRAGSGFGREASVAVAELEQAAADADVDLVVLRSTSPRQPGSRSWLWMRIEVKGLTSALDRTSLGDFLTALMPDGTEMRLAATLTDGRRTTLSAATTPVSTFPIGDGFGGALGKALSTAMTGVTGQITLAGIDATMKSSARSHELGRRILPGVNSFGQFGLIAVILAGLGGLPVALRWFGRVWPEERRDDYDGRVGHWAARAVRGAVFAIIALPLLAIPALVATVAGWFHRTARVVR